ncbi:hypothetical protein AGMMS49574_23230 [Bacteroidia bacterium]|nr:hypothetical protein AGMMS49574_23230 [Bacteroidia bacterium]
MKVKDFFVGIGLLPMLCLQLLIPLAFWVLIANFLCEIDPTKDYTWYSGIWHGLFVIPHWIVSWFSNDVFCKAPNSTIAYSIWWWITFIFSSFGILGIGGGK